MAKPVLHIIRGSGRLCKTPYTGSNWSEKYLDDEVARKLDICKVCKEKYIELNGLEMFHKIEIRLGQSEIKGIENCDCGCHPDDNSNITKYVNKKTNKPDILTLRMYLESY
jgi:hypothetical protein